jgi:hypothetical protein
MTEFQKLNTNGRCFQGAEMFLDKCSRIRIAFGFPNVALEARSQELIPSKF